MDLRKNALFAVIIGVIGFSMKSIFIKFSYENQLDLFSIMSLRMLLSIPFFGLAYLLFKIFGNEGNSTNKTNWKTVISCSIFYFFSSISNIAGLQYVSVTIERIILFLIPVFVLILSRFFLKKIYPIEVYVLSFISWFGVAIALLGNDYPKYTSGDNSLIGMTFIFLSALLYASYFMLSGTEMKNNGVIKFNTQVMILSGIYSIIIALLYEQHSISYFYSFSSVKYPFMLAFFSTVIPSFLMMYGVKHCGPEITATINNVGPFITIIIGYITLGETISFWDVLGMIIVMIAIVKINKIILQQRRLI